MESGRDDKFKVPNSHFDENRRKIQDHFLKKAVEEFHTAQGNYHRNMGKIVRGFDAVKGKFPTDMRYLINELLKPYRVLTKNPFRAPTGNVQNDLESIMITIKDQNDEFKKTLNAALEAISNLNKFNAFIKECERKEEVVDELNRNLEAQEESGEVSNQNDNKKEVVEVSNNNANRRRSLLDVTSMVSQPLPQVMQYPLLIHNIEKNIPSEVIMSNENLTEELENTMSILKPTLKTIEENKDDLIFLNKVEDVLKNLLSIEITKEEGEHNKSAPTNDNNSITSVSDEQAVYGDKLRHKIETILVSVQRGREKLLADSQDALSLQQGILDLLKDLQSHYENTTGDQGKSLVATATSYATSAGYYLLKLPVMFFSYNNDGNTNEQKRTNGLVKPELNKVIFDLTRFIEMKELAKSFIDDHLNKSLVEAEITRQTMRL